MKKSANSNQIILYVSHFLIVNAIFWGVRILNWWHFFGFPPMNPDFADIRAFTAQVTCAQKGIDYFETNCDPWNRGIGSLSVYVPILKLFNLNESRTGLLGNTFQVVLFLSIYMVAYAIKLDLSKLKNGILMLFVLVRSSCLRSFKKVDKILLSFKDLGF